jgi:proteasome accessory factor C
LDKFDRFQLLRRQFRQHRKPIPIARLAALLECSEKTVKRAIENMRDYLDAPIEYVPEAKGWAYVADEQGHYELPGLWLTSAELQSLALLLQLLESFGNGLLNQELVVVDCSRHRAQRLRSTHQSIAVK